MVASYGIHRHDDFNPLPPSLPLQPPPPPPAPARWDVCDPGSLALCALLFLVFLTLELDGSENVPSGTILAPLIALYALILVFLPLLLLVTRHYVRVRSDDGFARGGRGCGRCAGHGVSFVVKGGRGGDRVDHE